MHLLIYSTKLIKTMKCKLRIWRKPFFCIPFFMQSRMGAQMKGLFELRPLIYTHSFTSLSDWGVFVSLLVWKGFHIYQNQTSKPRLDLKSNVNCSLLVPNSIRAAESLAIFKKWLKHFYIWLSNASTLYSYSICSFFYLNKKKLLVL